MKTLDLKLLKVSILTFTLIIIILPNYIINGTATPARHAGNFDDTTHEAAYVVNDDTYGDMENLAIYYNLFEGSLISTGVRYRYVNYGPGTGPYDVEIRFEGDSFWVGYLDLGIPDVGLTPTWRTFRCLGPTYLIDDNPWVRFIGMDPSDDCIALCGDTPSIGNSWYDVGSGWTVDPNYEYIVELIYEWIITMNIKQKYEGSITDTDFVDAYFVTLSAGITYEFKLERTSGSGNLDMRLVTYQDLTNDVLALSSGTSDPEYMSYTPLSSATYILLVEPNNPATDIADYSIRYYDESMPLADFTANETYIVMGDWIQFEFTGNDGTTPTTYQWNFGDGSTNSTLENPIHQYNSTGYFSVSLWIKDKNNETDYEYKTNYIYVESQPLPQSPFIIDDLGNADYTWAEMADKNWCSGSGTDSDPYILQNLWIDGNNLSSCIEIRNSIKYFQMIYCEFQESLYNSDSAGIKLFNVSNGVLSNNTYVYNGNGIILIDCHNITIIGSFIYDNGWNGIKLINSHNITIKLNYDSINGNFHAGIYLLLSSHNIIIENSIKHNQFGIYFYESDYNIVKFNEFLNNEENIKEINCVGNVIESNVFISPPSGDNTPYEYVRLFIIILISLLALAVLIMIAIRLGKIKMGTGEKSEHIELVIETEQSIQTQEAVLEPHIERKLKIFLCFSVDDSENFNLAKIAKALEEYPEIDKVFYWEEKSYQNVVELMEEALQNSNVFIIFCSENSEKSRDVKDQWQAAFQLQKKEVMKIIPVHEEEKFIPYMLMPMLNVKYTNDDFEGFIQNLYKEILRR